MMIGMRDDLVRSYFITIRLSPFIIDLDCLLILIDLFDRSKIVKAP